MKDPIPPVRTHLFGSRFGNILNPIRCKSVSYNNSLYPDSIKCWNKIGRDLRNSPNLNSFKANILALVRPPIKSIFDIHDPPGIKTPLSIGDTSLGVVVNRLLIKATLKFLNDSKRFL